MHYATTLGTILKQILTREWRLLLLNRQTISGGFWNILKVKFYTILTNNIILETKPDCNKKCQKYFFIVLPCRHYVVYISLKMLFKTFILIPIGNRKIFIYHVYEMARTPYWFFIQITCLLYLFFFFCSLGSWRERRVWYFVLAVVG